MKTYSEQRRAILFKASRDLRAVAASVLDDVTEEAELTGHTTVWAKAVAAETARLANEMEEKGYEQATPYDARADAHLRRSKEAYSEAITAFMSRVLEAGGTLP